MWVTDGLGVMSIGFMLPQQDNAVIWRGPKKNGLIKQFLTVRHRESFLPSTELEECFVLGQGGAVRRGKGYLCS